MYVKNVLDYVFNYPTLSGDRLQWVFVRRRQSTVLHFHLYLENFQVNFNHFVRRRQSTILHFHLYLKNFWSILTIFDLKNLYDQRILLHPWGLMGWAKYAKKKPVEQINFKGKNILIPILKVYCEPVKLKEIMLES